MDKVKGISVNLRSPFVCTDLYSTFCRSLAISAVGYLCNVGSMLAACTIVTKVRGLSP
jgi:hypothetical protein